jgi:hypothetical protein
MFLESVTVDYVCGTPDELTRRAKLVPWTEDDLTEDIDYQQTEPNEEYFNVFFIYSCSMIHYLIVCPFNIDRTRK